MKVILYMAVTVNGLIAREDDDVGFISEAEWQSFRAKVKEAGNLIVGLRTYEIMRAENSFRGLEEIEVIRVGRGNMVKPDNLPHTSAESPKEAVDRLARRGFEAILIGGGGELNGACMEAGLIDEIFLDVEPAAFGKGIRLFGGGNFDAKLQLLGDKRLSPDEIQLHYKVAR